MPRITLKLIPTTVPVSSGLTSEEIVREIKIDSEVHRSSESYLTLGRCAETGIVDKRCSRDHVRVWIDTEAEEIVFQQMGSNPSCVQHSGDEYVLTKHLVKRLPLMARNISSSTKQTLYLINKDRLYGYEVITPTMETKASNGDSAAKRGTKRNANTIDDYLMKKPKSAESLSKGEWSEPEKKIFVYTMEEAVPRCKLAAFDMDGTLITTASGAKWPKDKNDWKFLYPEVPKKLKELYADNYKLVIFTNQGSIANGTCDPADIKEKIENIIQCSGVPAQAVIAGCKHGMHRKPAPGMWNHIVMHCNGDVDVNIDDSLFVGDAAGRPAGWVKGKKKDFACSDRLFAMNIGVKFHTPEAFFKGMEEAKFELPEFDPSKISPETALLEPKSSQLSVSGQEMIVMVGFPGSGKSQFSTTHLADYARVNRDTLGSWQKCVAKAEEHLKSGRSVVVDNTNPDADSRSRYVNLAIKYKVPVRCFLMSTTYKHARHNEKFRQLTNKDHKPIPEMVVNSYKSKYTEPSLSEDFTEVVRVNFVPDFASETQKKTYMLHLLEK